MSERDEKLFGGNLRATGLTVSANPDGVGKPLRKLALTRLDIDGVEGEFAGLDYRANEVSLDGLSNIIGRKQISAEAADVADLELRGEGFRAHIRRISCASGVLSAGVHELIAPHVSFQDVHLVIDDLGALSARESDPAEPISASDGPAPEPGDAVAGESINLHCLDALQGQLDIDLAVDMTLPWLKRRNVTHYFRVPIVDGTLDYKRLEDDVHWLEAAFLTVEQVDGRLVLARDLPLVPYSGKALLTWQLEPEDIPVADLHRVHLRNLVRPQVPEERRNKHKKSRLVLHELGMNNIKLALRADKPVQLSLPGGAMLQFGDDDSAGLSGLTMEGELRYVSPLPDADSDADSDAIDSRKAPATGGEPERSPLTSLQGSVELLDVTLQDLQIGPARISVDRLHIGSIERIQLWFDGFRPQRLELSIGRMAATNLRLQTLGEQN